MAIMRTGPGKRTKTTSKKVTAKDVTSKLQSIFSPGGGKNIGKSKGAGALAGVASRTNKKTTSSTGSAVTGKSRVNTKLLEGAVRNLPETKVTGKKQPAKKTYGERKNIHVSEVPKNPKASPSPYKSTYYTSQKSIPTDSTKFMQQMLSTNPDAYKVAMNFMKKQQAKNPGARFEFGGTEVGQTTSSINYARKGETAKYNPKTKDYSYSVPVIKTVLPNKKKKK